MRGADHFTESLFIMRKLEDYVPADHPLRPIRAMVNEALARLDSLFQQMYADDVLGGRPSIAPEKLLRAMLLQVLHSVRSERMLMEQIHYNMLYRWFVGLPMDAEVWVPTVFSKNRERLIKHDAVVAFFNEVLAIAERNRWLSEEHFSVDGTLIQAWAGHKSFVRKDGDDDDGGDFRGTSRSNETHASTTDPDARLYRKAKTASELRYMGHILIENRNGLVVSGMVTRADGHAEREAAKAMIGDAVQAAADDAQARDVDLYWAYHNLSGALTLTLGETGRLDRLSNGLCRSGDLESACDYIVRFAAAGFRAVCDGPHRDRA